MKRCHLLWDERPTSGAGHRRRCEALNGALQAEGWRCSVQEPLPGARIDLAVLDDYRFGEEQDSAVAEWADLVAVFDDLGDRPRRCDVLVAPSAGSAAGDYLELVPATCEVLAGPDFAPLHPSFAAHRADALRRRRETTELRRAVVAFGAYDSRGLAHPAAVAALSTSVDAVTVLVGSGSPTLASLTRLASEDDRVELVIDSTDVAALLAAADVAIGAAGVSALERCVVGLPSVVTAVAANQVRQVQSLAAAGAAAAVEPEGFADAVAALLADLARWREMSTAAATVTDGSGARRLARALTDRTAATR